MALFSMLFGAGILLLAERLEARKEASLNIHYTRNGILAVVGLIHGLLWFGDVLLIYALCAFVLFHCAGGLAEALCYSVQCCGSLCSPPVTGLVHLG